jgi:hypothetical protein
MWGPSSGLGPDITTPLRKDAAVHLSKNCAMMSQTGHTRSSSDGDSMSGLPESGHGWAIYEYAI